MISEGDVMAAEKLLTTFNARSMVSAGNSHVIDLLVASFLIFPCFAASESNKFVYVMTGKGRDVYAKIYGTKA